MADLVQRYADQILGVLSCYDRVIVRGRIQETFGKSNSRTLCSRRYTAIPFA
jgi:hypothetical protein